MKLRSAIAFLLVSSAFGSSAAPAMADYVIFAFEGEITSVEDDDNLLGGAVTVGSPFSGTYTFDPLTPDSDPHPRRGLYWDAIIDISGNVAGVPFSGPIGSRNSFLVENDFGSTTLDEYFIRADASLSALDLDILIAFLDGSGSVFTSDHLPTSPPDIGLFDIRQFIVSDVSEIIPVRLQGEVGSLTLVPDPGTLAMLGVGMFLIMTGRGRRRTGKIPPQRGATATCLDRLPMLIVVAGVVHLNIGTPVSAEDCNNNGVEDAQELAECSPIEVVFIFDTSESMDGYILEVCARIDDALVDLAQDGPTVSSERLAIETGSSCFCCEPTLSNVHDRYGDEAIGYPEVPRLGLCNPKQDGNEEDWAPATAIVAANKSWTEGGIRIIVPISDEGPRCGDPVSDPGSDRDAIEAAIDGIHTFSSVESQSAVFITYSGGQFVHAQNKEAL